MTKKKTLPPLAGLKKRYTKNGARDFVDFDYIASLSDEEKAWLDKFSREYYQVRFLADDANLHGTPEQRHKCYSADNARRRDVFSSFQQVDAPLEEIEEMPSYKSPKPKRKAKDTK